ncbi:MAG: ATP-binding protein [Burkholderiales bacterium]|nr:ATP-binding protein [Burkholderiales bacterium]
MAEARRFCARMSALPELLACVRASCAAAAVEPAVLRRIELVLEELFTNTVTHGYGGDCDAPVWLCVTPAAEALSITYADAGTPFDPLEHRTDLDLGNARRPQGGLGVLLVRRLADAIGYHRDDGRNVVTLRFSTAARP